MDIGSVNLLVYDNQEHYVDNYEFLAAPLYKSVDLVKDINDISEKLKGYQPNEYVVLLVHVFYTKKIKGIKKFASERVRSRYPNLPFFYVTDGIGADVQKDMVDAGLDYDKIYKYHDITTLIEDDSFKAFTVKEIIENTSTDMIENTIGNSSKNYEYAIITALEDEMKPILKLIEEKSHEDDNKSHRICFGVFKENTNKRVVYVSQQSTGMIDAAILATDIISKYNPKFLIMPGVLAGRADETNLGDVIVSTKIFTIDKGKIKGDRFDGELETVHTENAIVSAIKRKKIEIENHITDADQQGRRVEIHFGPVACVRQVIDKKGFFDDISSIDRKVIALEMESYGIARACEIVNNRNTIPLIIKSVMDNGVDKTDGSKSHAAWTSAETIRFLIKENII